MKKPKTKFEDLTDFYKEIKAMQNLLFARIEAKEKKEKAFSFYEEQMKAIHHEYKKILHEEDCYFFTCLDEMKKFMKTNKIDEKEINKTIEHEKAHYEKALELGHSLKGFLLWFAIDKNKKIKYVPVTWIKFYDLSYDAYKKIMKAPKEPSFLDVI